MQENIPTNPDAWTIITVLLVSAISGTVSITRRVANGTPASVAWLISEFMAAILCGWLAFDAFDHVSRFMPDWVTMPVFVAVCAHTGGRLLQASSHLAESRIPDAIKRKR